MKTEGEGLQPGSTVTRTDTHVTGEVHQFDTTVLPDGSIDFEHYGVFGCTTDIARFDASGTTAAGLPISDAFLVEPSPPC